jgi:NAD(P)-dependent dehydrogenase (short-subunit alcohol dehydrogenase family)
VQRAFFSLLRRSAGVTVLLSSEVALAAGAATAFTGPYAASKMALEALATSLRQELSMLDPPLPLVVVNPGATSTPMLDAAVASNFTKHIAAGSLWAGALGRGCAAAQRYILRHARPAGTVADAIVTAVRAASPPQRVVVNGSWEMWILAWVPQRLVNAVISWGIGPANP